MRRRLAAALAFAPPQAGNHSLAIAGFRAWRLKEPVSGRQYTVVRLQSQSGDAGYGEGGPCAGTDIAEAKAAIAGRRATESEFVRARLAAIPAMEAAVSNAMVDLVSRSRKLPVYQYLGGPVRFKARLLAQLEGTDEATTAAPFERARRAGFLAMTMPVLPRDVMIPLQEYVDRVRKRVAAFQARGGAGIEWVLDGRGSLAPGDAATVATALEKTYLIWFDEPTRIHTTDALAKIVDESVMPVGIGRHVTDIGAFQNLLRFGSANVVRPSLGLNSLAKLKRIAAIAETHYVAISPYHAGGPIGTLAGIHLNAALTNAFAQEVPIPAADRDAAMRAAITRGNREFGERGFAALLNRPGLGVEIDDRALDAQSEERI